ncbi:hypothetical protein QQF64_035542 [Cirrhinus molitorella]|uniref:Uncharacterized protein n=1 Tax=Cirrhinus molitorella TaxID=172907 RepID=A0ABR3NGA6_9TELE
MKWLETVRSLFKGGSRSAPVTPTSSPSMPSKKDLSAKQSCVYHSCRCLEFHAPCSFSSSFCSLAQLDILMVLPRPSLSARLRVEKLSGMLDAD